MTLSVKQCCTIGARSEKKANKKKKINREYASIDNWNTNRSRPLIKSQIERNTMSRNTLNVKHFDRLWYTSQARLRTFCRGYEVFFVQFKMFDISGNLIMILISTDDSKALQSVSFVCVYFRSKDWLLSYF